MNNVPRQDVDDSPVPMDERDDALGNLDDGMQPVVSFKRLKRKDIVGDSVPMDERDNALGNLDDGIQPATSLKRLKHKDIRYTDPDTRAKRNNKRPAKRSRAEIMADPNKEKAILDNYEFPKPDEDAYAIESVDDDEDESHLGGFVDNGKDQMARKEIRQNLDMKDENPGLHKAFMLLSDGNWIGFLESVVMQEKMRGVVDLSLISFGTGSGGANIRRLWELAWTNDLIIYRRHTALVNHWCIACDQPKVLVYELYEIFENEPMFRGCMGPQCCEIRFMPLVNFAYGCQQLARDIIVGQLDPKTNLFETLVTKKLERLLDTVAKSAPAMQEHQDYKAAQREALQNKYGKIIKFSAGNEDESKLNYNRQVDIKQGNDAICNRNADNCSDKSIPDKTHNYIDLTNNDAEMDHNPDEPEEIDEDSVQLFSGEN